MAVTLRVPRELVVLSKKPFRQLRELLPVTFLMCAIRAPPDE